MKIDGAWEAIMSNPVKEYLVSIGLDLNKTKLQQTQKGIKDTTNLIDKMRAASDFLKRGLNGVALSMLAVTGASAKLVTSLAKQDQQFETIAQRLFVTKKSVYEYQYAVKALGVSIDEIQFNPTLMKQYRELVANGRRMFAGDQYEGAMKGVRSFLFEFVRLKQESMYLLQWIGFSIVKNLQAPLEKARATIRGLNDFIVKNMSKIGDVVSKMIFNAKNFGKSVVGFFAGMVKEITQFWASLPGWAKKFILGTGIIGAVFIGLQNPLVFVSALIGGVMLLIDDFQKHVQGKKAKFGEFWDNLIKWVKRTRETIYEWKEAGVKWIENFVSLCKTKIPELKTIWDNVSKWISENGMKSVDSLTNLISTVDDFFARLGFYWGRLKANPFEFWAKLSTGELGAEFDALQLEKRKAAMEGRTTPASGEVIGLGNIPGTSPVNGGGKWDAMISEFSVKYGVSSELLRAVMMQESGGDPNARSAAGAQGLMQLMPATAKDLGVTDPFDPRQNLEAGAKYLGQLKQRYGGDRKKMLMAYNWGMGNVDDLYAGRLSSSQVPAETRNYVESVLGRIGTSRGANVTPLVQQNKSTCGVVSVAMANNAINRNTNLTESGLFAKYGYNLLGALNATVRKGVRWRDLGNPAIGDEELAAMANASAQGLPFIFAANGPQFSRSGRGHFMVGKSVDRKKKLVTYVDPADGKVKTCTFADLKKAGLHPQGNAVFVPSLTQPPKPPVQKPVQLSRGTGGRINASSFKVQQEDQRRYWFDKMRRGAIQKWNEINPFVNRQNIDDLTASSGFFNTQNSNVYVGGITVTVNTNSTDPRAIGAAVADNLQNRMNYFALNRGLNLS